MSTPFHEDMFMSFYAEELASMKQSGMASLMTDADLTEHCEFIDLQTIKELQEEELIGEAGVKTPTELLIEKKIIEYNTIENNRFIVRNDFGFY